jgi:hypothetical protein
MSSAIHALALLCLFAATLIQPVAADELAAQFSQPPAATKPRCYWYWMDGHISKDGITKDLEAMKRVGIGGAFIGVISGQSGAAPNPDPKALTPPWWGFIEHAIREGSRIGVQIGLFNSPGWSQTGGPWVTPEQAMRYVVQTETRCKARRNFPQNCPRPRRVSNHSPSRPSPRLPEMPPPPRSRPARAMPSIFKCRKTVRPAVSSSAPPPPSTPPPNSRRRPMARTSARLEDSRSPATTKCSVSAPCHSRRW